MHPGHSIDGIDVHQQAANFGAFLIRRNVQSRGEIAFHQVTWHGQSPCMTGPCCFDTCTLTGVRRASIGHFPYLFLDGEIAFGSYRPNLTAAAAASPRERTPSLASTEETWWPTVFSETNRRRA